MKTIIIVVLAIMLVSCGSFLKEELPGAVVTKPDGFRAINTYTYVIKYKDGSKISETVTVTGGNRSALDVVFDMVEPHVADTSRVKSYYVKPVLNK